MRLHGLWPTRLLCPWDFRKEYWRGLPFPSPRNLLNPEIEPASPLLQVVSCIAGRLLHCKWILYCWATREAQGKHDRENRGKPFKHGSLKIDNHRAIPNKNKEKMNLTIPRMKKCHYKSYKYFGHSFIEIKFTYLMWMNTQKIFNFSTTLPTLIFFLIIAILRGVRWYLLWFWFTFLWWVIILSIFSYTYRLFLYLLWRNVHSSLWLIF